MTGASSNIIAIGRDDSPVLTTELDPTSTAEKAVLHVAGDLDIATAATLLEALTSVAESGCAHVDVRMREVRFCDGSGLAVLVEGRRRIAAKGGGITLHDPCRSLQRILDICDLNLDLQTRTPAGAHAPAEGSDSGSKAVSDDVTAGPDLRLLPPLREAT